MRQQDRKPSTQFNSAKLALPCTALALLAAPIPARAKLPDPVRAMIEAAIATGDADKVKTVSELARQTNPGDAAEVEGMQAKFHARQVQLAAEEAEREVEQIRSAGLFDMWSGKGEIGASLSTGNSDEIGVTLGLAFERKGIDWRHKLTASADYHRTNGATTKEQFLVAYEPNLRLGKRAFVYGLAQWERDRFQGFSSRISLSGGLGYRFADRDGLHFSVKAGPAWRRTSLIPAGTRSQIAALAALDFDWQFAENLKLTQAASAYLQANNSTFKSTTGLQARLNGDLSARVSYTLEYDTSPPPGAVKTDTLSRFTLIYDF